MPNTKMAFDKVWFEGILRQLIICKSSKPTTWHTQTEESSSLCILFNVVVQSRNTLSTEFDSQWSNALLTFELLWFVCLFVCLLFLCFFVSFFLCLTATSLSLPRSWKRIRVWRSNKVRVLLFYSTGIQESLRSWGFITGEPRWLWCPTSQLCLFVCCYKPRKSLLRRPPWTRRKAHGPGRKSSRALSPGVYPLGSGRNFFFFQKMSVCVAFFY